MNKHLILLFIPLLFWSCKKDTGLSETPEIQWLDYGPAVILEAQDSVYFAISYTDKDGDLGENQANAKNLYVRDERIPLTYSYRISALVPDGKTAAIKGELHFSLRNTVLAGSGNEESVTYTVWVEDRAGNQSNKLKTEGLVVKSP